MATGESFTVKLSGGGPWGFRLQGGADFGMPLQIAKIRKRSKADSAGIAENDLIVSVEGQDMRGRRHTDAMALIDASTGDLTIQLLRERGAPPPKQTQMVVEEDATQRPSAFTPVANGEVVNEPLQRVSQYSSRKVITKQTVSDGITVHQTTSTTNTEETDGKKQSWHTREEKTIPQLPQFKPKFNAHQLQASSHQPITMDVQVSPSQQISKMDYSSNFQDGGSSRLKFTADVSTEQVQKENVAPAYVPSYVTPTRDTPQFRVSKVEKTPNKWQPSYIPPLPEREPEEPLYIETQQPVLQDSEQYQPPMFPQRLGHPHLNLAANHPYHKDIIRIVTTEVPLPHPDVKHIPGMIKPGTIDLSHTLDLMPDVSSPDRRRKQFSDSAFYDESNALYPTIEEQIELCRQIAGSLEAAANKKARGAKMFMKRKTRATTWTTTDEHGLEHFDDFDGGSRDEGGLFRFRIPKIATQVNNAEVTKTFLTQDEFNVIKNSNNKMFGSPLSPNAEITSSIVSDLEHSKGRGAKIFARRRARSENWVVDETNVKSSPVITAQSVLATKIEKMADKASYCSPWEAAVGDPLGRLDKAFEFVDHNKNKATNGVPHQQTPQQSYLNLRTAHVPPKPMPKPQPSWNNTSMDYRDGPQAMMSPGAGPMSPGSSNDSGGKFQDFNAKLRGWGPVTPPGKQVQPQHMRSKLSQPEANQYYNQSEIQQTPNRQFSKTYNKAAKPFGFPGPGDYASDVTSSNQARIYASNQSLASNDSGQGYRSVDYRSPQNIGYFAMTQGSAQAVPTTEVQASDF